MGTSLFSAIRFQKECKSWQHAVEIACQPLEENGIISGDYSQAIIRETEINGPWYILSPAFALPHARPEEGVLSPESHLSLLCLENNIEFPEHPDVRLIIILAAANSNQHIEKIQQLMCWLDEEDRLEMLSTIKSRAELNSLMGTVNEIRPLAIE